MKQTIVFISLVFLILLISSCSMKPTVTVTIHNTTRVRTGNLEVISGNYEAEYADEILEFRDVSFPYSVTIPAATACANYFVITELEDWLTGTSLGAVFIDTRIGSEIEATIDLMLYIIRDIDDYEPDNDFDSAGVIQIGEYQARSLMDIIDVDYVSFYAVSGRAYSVEIERHEGSQTNLTLYDPNHTELAYDENSGYDGASKITWSAPYTGVCFIKVDNSSSYIYYGLILSHTSAGNAIQSARNKFNVWTYF